MREIKFRGKRTDNGEWVYGDLIQIEDDCYIFDYAIADNGVSDVLQLYQISLKVAPSTVGQYTGQKTDNCEIYEGDMCIVTRFNRNGRDYQYECIVEWLGGGFYFICEEKEMYIPVSEVADTVSDVEVIGNIYDNPELLKAGGKR